MSKRSAQGQGDKFGGLPDDDEERFGKPDPVVKATAAQLAGRKIASMKTKRTASPGRAAFGSPMANSSFSAMGNPFGGNGSDNNNNSSQQPNTGFSFGSSTPTFGSNTNSTPMFGSNTSSAPAFGSNNTSATPSFGNFGAASQGPAATSNIFGSMAGSSSGFSFGGGAGGNNPFASSQPAASQPNQGFSFNSTPAPSNTTPGTFGLGKSNTPFAGFGQANTTNGATSANTADNDMMISPPASPEKKGTGLKAAPAASIFGTMSGNSGQPAANPFGAVKNDAPKEAPKFSFGQTSTKAADSTTAAPTTTLFTGFGTSSSTKPDTAASKTADKPAPVFGSSTATPSFGFDAANASSPAKPAEASNSSNINRATESATESATSGTSNTTSSPFKGFNTTTTNATPFKGFGGFAQSQTPQAAPASNPFAQPNTPAPQAATETPAKPTFSLFGAKTAEPTPAPPASTTTTQAPSYPSLPAPANTSAPVDLSEDLKQAYILRLKLRALNANMLATLMDMDQTLDWTDMMKAYISYAASFTTGATPTATSKRPREVDDVSADSTSKRVRSDDASQSETGSPSKSKTAALFQNILDRKDDPSTPPKTSTSLFAPSTTPSGSPAKNAFVGFGTQPKASQTNAEEARPANPFASVAKAPATAPPMFGSKAPATLSAATPAATKSAGSNTLEVKPNQSAVASPFTFKPVTTTPAASATPSFQVPKFGNGAPSGTNFMASFAANAQENTAKMMAEAKAKRKAEDFDSDEDDEEEWERKDAEEQAAKKAKLDEDAKKVAKFVPGQGFVFGDAAEAPKEAAPAAIQVPKFGNGSTAPTNFLSSFSANAKENTEKMLAEAKAKRKAEDFDSEEDDEEEWERKDAEEQAAKKAKLEADSKKVAKFVPGKGFVFEDSSESSGVSSNATASPATAAAASSATNTQTSSASVFDNNAKATPAPSNPFAKFAAKPADDATDHEDSADHEATDAASEKPTTNGKSMFDRVTPAEKPTSALFGSPAQDKTWKPDSPIKFSDAKPNVGFSFGVAVTPKTDTSGAAPSTSAFGFLSKPNSTMTSAATSRAGSPGHADSDAAADGPADADTEDSLPQTDLTALTADEKRTETVLFEVERARCMFYNKSLESPWEVKGTGPLRVLKNKNTDIVRIVLRVAPTGKVAINTRLAANVNYDFKGKGMVQFGIAKDANTVESWMIKVKEDDVAKQFAGICKDWQNH